MSFLVGSLAGAVATGGVYYGFSNLIQTRTTHHRTEPSYSYAAKAAAIAGYPLVSVPLGFLPDDIEPTPNPPTPLFHVAPGMPFGLCFMGTAYSEYQLIGFAYAFEQATQVRLRKRAFVEAIPKTQLKDVMSD